MANEFKRMQKLAGIITESQIKENRIGALLNTVADDWGEDSDFYSDLEDSLTGWVDRNGQLTPKGKISIKNLLSNWDLLDDYGHFLDDEEMNEGDEDYYKDAEADDAEHIDALEKDMKDDAKHTSEGKMKMSDLKKAIKELAEMDGAAVTNADYDPVAEASEFDMNKAARIKEFIRALNKLIDEYHSELYLNDDLFAAIERVIKAAKEEAMNSELSEAKKDKEVEDTEDVDVTVGDEETTADVTTTDVDPDVKVVQDALTQAQAAAEKLGDDKLTDQIGNTITFFTRTHIVDKPGMTAESNIKERISKLVKSL
jgi:hypothetical protein